MKKLFLASRLHAIYRLLTCPWFVVITSKGDTSLNCRYNVNHASFRLLVETVDPALAEKEATAALLNEANSILKK